ncbi:MAG: chorismate mutase [Kiritimatiellaeota bacterium]|nr:chorismate mutase [Kiritimatiellota bacterium]
MIDAYRREIDALDGELLEILARRSAVVRKIGEYKRQRALPVVDPARKREVSERFASRATALGLDATFARRLYELVHEEAVREEESVAPPPNKR